VIPTIQIERGSVRCSPSLSLSLSKGFMDHPSSQKVLPLDWTNIVLLATVHVVAIGGTALYLPLHGLSLAALLIGVSLTGLTIFSISAGYHRLFSHCTYEAHPVLRFLLLFIGAGSFQNSVIAWASDHRRHHARTDTDLDPYSAKRGFWYSHIGWVIRKADPDITPMAVRDLERDPLVRWQHRRYPYVATAAGVGLPVLLGFIFGDPWGGFIIGGAVRLLVCFHTTFSINSFAHLLGKQPYSDRNTARDSFVTALISMGEGYHNFHHTFPSDYRNGVRPHQFDPTKWTLRALAAVGLAKNLRRTSRAAVLRARVRMDERRVAVDRLSPAARERLQQIRAALDHALFRWNALVAQVEAIKREASAQARALLRALRAELRAVSRELAEAYASWQKLLRSPELAAAK
jgi:stearoyl-CoA desaturase (Delta-9 desaturase)